MKALPEIQAALHECQHHAAVLHQARIEIGNKRFAPESVDDISSETLRLLDQLAYRFGMTPLTGRRGKDFLNSGLDK